MKKRLLSLVLVVALALSLAMLPTAAAAGKEFGDMNGHWSASSVDRWSSAGIFNGDDNNNFNPDKQMTRGEFAQMLVNMMGYTQKGNNPFSDVPANAWYADAILKLNAAGIMQGDGAGKANPESPISRQEAAVLICRALGIKPSAGASMSFADSASVASWAKDSVAALSERGMISGMGGNVFAPGVDINRASVAKLIDNAISAYVTENGATVSGTQNGVVIVAAANVKLEDATLNENVIVAPKAANTTVTLTGSTQASDVIVAAQGASVVVSATASAGDVAVEAQGASAEIAGTADSVTVAAPSAKAAVSGKVESIAVAETASGAGVTVAAAAEVGKVEVSAPNTTTQVAGKVESVAVSGTASNATVNTSTGAKIESVTTDAAGTKVTGASGTVGTVTADKNATGTNVSTTGTKVENNSSSTVTAGGTTVKPNDEGTVTPSAPSFGGGGVVTPPTVKAPVIEAPIVDHPEKKQGGNAENALANPGTVTVDGTQKSGTNNEYDVVITGKKIMNHTNADGNDGYWVGFGMPAKTGEGSYSYYVDAATSPTASIADRTYEKDGKTYNTVYFEYSTEAAFNAATRKITVKDGEDVISIYNVTFKVDFYKVTDIAVAQVTETDRAEDYSAVSDALVSGFSANGLNVTLTGEIDPAKLVEGKYTYYALDVNDGNIKSLNNTGAGSAGFPTASAKGLTVATKIYENNELRKVQHVYEAKDAAGRVQDTFTVTVDATGCSVANAKKVTVKFVMGDKIEAKTVIVGSEDVSVDVPELKHTDNLYFTGVWKIGTDKATITNNKYAISKDTKNTEITLTAENVPIVDQEFKVRPIGPEAHTDHETIEKFDYEKAYGYAGLTLENGVITLDASELLKFIEAKDDNAAVKQTEDAVEHEKEILHLLGHGAKASKLFFGVHYVFPSSISGEAKSIVCASTLDGLATSKATLNLATDGNNVLGGKFINYFATAEVKNENEKYTVAFIDDNAAEKDTDYYLWKDSEGNALVVTKANIKVVTTNIPTDNKTVE